MVAAVPGGYRPPSAIDQLRPGPERRPRLRPSQRGAVRCPRGAPSTARFASARAAATMRALICAQSLLCCLPGGPMAQTRAITQAAVAAASSGSPVLPHSGSIPLSLNLLDDGTPDPDCSQIKFDVDDPSAIRARSLPWTAYKTLVSDRTVSLMQQYDKQSSEAQNRLLAKSGDDYAEAFVQLLSHLHHIEPLQYILTMVNDMLSADESRAACFHHLVTKGVDPYLPFVRMLSLQNWYILRNAAEIVSLLLSTSDVAPRSHHELVVRWLCRLLAATTLPDSAASALLDVANRILRVNENREVFAAADGLQRLNALAARFRGQIAMYKVGVALWLVSYSDRVAALFQKEGLLPLLCEVVKKVDEKEKVLRVFLACLKNVVQLGIFNEDLIDLGLLKTVTLMSTPTDADMADDVKFITETLQRDYREYSTFEKYQKEVLEGRLDWSPAHTSEQFWRENINRFEARNFELIRVLVATLKKDSATPKELCVCLNDLGEFARGHARGKAILEELKGKERVMELLTHPDPSVKKHALLCMQKMLVQKHQFMIK